MEFWRNLPSCADFAISESQFQSFILNPSRRLFRDGFFTSSFCPEFYTQLRYDRVMDNGLEKMMGNAERASHRNHAIKVGPDTNDSGTCRRAAPVIDAFDPWARQGGEYYSLQ
jgi:hypothetical protein